MARALLAACFFACVISAQQSALPTVPSDAQAPEPPEEDESLAPKVYALNPVQAKKEIVAGDYYFKKPNYSAAIRRYTEATKWDPGSAEAFHKLGEVHEKLREYALAREAYLKYIALGADPKESDALRKKIAQWPDTKAKTESKTQSKK